MNIIILALFLLFPVTVFADEYRDCYMQCHRITLSNEIEAAAITCTQMCMQTKMQERLARAIEEQNRLMHEQVLKGSKNDQE